MATRTKKRGRRTYAELFLDALTSLTVGDSNNASNASLRAKLGWEKDRYERIKSQLLSQNRIEAGRGRGGTVSVIEDPTANALKVFISYSHADEGITKELLKHIEPLKKLNLIESWHDRKLKAGEKWGDTISKHLESADIILIVVSIDFINSDYCFNNELEKALELNDAEECEVIPIIARSCMWKSAPFSKLQALPKDGKPISQWIDKDEALTNVAEGIELTARKLLT